MAASRERHRARPAVTHDINSATTAQARRDDLRAYQSACHARRQGRRRHECVCPRPRDSHRATGRGRGCLHPKVRPQSTADPGDRSGRTDHQPGRRPGRTDRQERPPTRSCPSSQRRVSFLDWNEGVRYDVVHAHYWLSGKVAEYLRSYWEAPYVLMFHTTADMKNAVLGGNDQESALRQETEHELVRTADSIIAANPDERADLVLEPRRSGRTRLHDSAGRRSDPLPASRLSRKSAEAGLVDQGTRRPLRRPDRPDKGDRYLDRDDAAGHGAGAALRLYRRRSG